MASLSPDLAAAPDFDMSGPFLLHSRTAMMFAHRPAAYKAYGSSKEDAPACEYPGFEHTEMELLRHVSFVDCPGEANGIMTGINLWGVLLASIYSCLTGLPGLWTQLTVRGL
jgi:hypothetical protein